VSARDLLSVRHLSRSNAPPWQRCTTSTAAVETDKDGNEIPRERRTTVNRAIKSCRRTWNGHGGDPRHRHEPELDPGWRHLKGAAISSSTAGANGRSTGTVRAGRGGETTSRYSGFNPLPITWAHAIRAYDIASGHPDPFDRVLLAQAITEPLHLLTTDEALAPYSHLVVAV